MRAFVTEVEDDELEGMKRVSEAFDSKVVYRKQKPVHLLTTTLKVRSVSAELRKAAITYIIK